MKKILGIVILMLALMALVASPALAAVTFNTEDGTGFVGKGDVQIAFGWNNAQLQNNANEVTFTYMHTDTYEVVNAWATGNPENPVSLNYHTATVTTTVDVNAVIVGSPRKVNGQQQFTGFNLTGFGDSTVIGTIPVVSPTITWVTYNWDEQVWDGTYDTVPNPNYNGHNSPTIQVKHYVTVTHVTDQLPAYYDNGNLVLYSEGDNKAVLSVTLLNSTGGLYANFGGNSVLLDWPPVVTP
jgi:hypothetical protein